MDKITEFEMEKKKNIDAMDKDSELKKLSYDWFVSGYKYKYSYNFTWLGRPIIQYPQDIAAMQEIIWSVKPDLIIETGIAHGGSLIFYASMLELIGGEGEVLGIDIDIRQHNRTEIEKHKMYKRITMIEGSSVDEEVVSKVYGFARNKEKVLVVLDSMHTYSHVLQELRAYSPLVTAGSYLVVFDTIVEDIPEELFTDRPWGKGKKPKTAVYQFIKENDRFEVDYEIEKKLLITAAPNGYLKCIK
jgi:cephalosporin hydroxylase